MLVIEKQCLEAGKQDRRGRCLKRARCVDPFSSIRVMEPMKMLRSEQAGTGGEIVPSTLAMC